MLTHEEYAALLLIVQRAPMTMPELIAIRAILAKLEPPKQEPKQE